MGKINWTLQTFKLDELTDYYKNPRSLSDKEFKQLKKSLDTFGMIDKPIVNLDSANTIIGGHQRKHVLDASGVKECECWIPDRVLSDKEVEELNIRLNKNTGSWDFDTLANEFQLDDLLDWGFDKGELDLDLWAEEAPEDVEPQIDKADELQEKWNVESGQLWQLGEHRIICGDSSARSNIAKVMDGDIARLVWTDPPYGVKLGVGVPLDNPQHWVVRSIKNDDLSPEQLLELIFTVLKHCAEFTSQGASIYMAAPSGNMLPVLLNSFNDSGFTFHWNLVWVKDQLVLGRGDYHMKHENILYGWKPDGAHYFVDDRKQTSVFEYPRPKISKEHPTMKPVELIEHMVRNSSEIHDIVLEPFSGSGTTLIACERLGRKCRAVEISPAYVSVAIQRWVDVTGGEPVLIGED